MYYFMKTALIIINSVGQNMKKKKLKLPSVNFCLNKSRKITDLFPRAFTVHQMQMCALYHKKYNLNLSFMLTYLYTLYSRLADQETVLFNKTYRSIQKGC